METSDSECFESADEEFISDTEPDSLKKITNLPPKPVKFNIKEDKTKDNNVSNEEELPKEAQSPENDGAKSVKHQPDVNKPKRAIKPTKPQSIEKLSITEDKTLNISKDNNVSNEKEQSQSSENNGAPSGKQKPVINKPERKTKPSRATLGVKLGTKIKSNADLPQSDKKTSLQTKIDSEPEHEVKNTTNIDHADNACPREESNADLQSRNNNNQQVCESEWECKNNEQEVNISEDKEENLWDDDEDWEPAPNKKPDEFSTDWSGWGNWGVTSLLSTATMGVTTIKNHVSQGLNTVLESGIGVPQPEELARLHKEEKQTQQESNTTENKDPSASTFGLGSFVSGVSQITKLVETTSNKVISSGLDTLETIGKKTMEVLQEGDPGLKKKRAFLKIESDKPVLSQMLREAKEKAENENKLLEEKHYSRKANYETLFDDHQGLVHLEALEMLSKQCDIKLQNLLESQSGTDLTEMQETLNQIKELCELPEDEDETILPKDEIEEQLNTAASEMNIPISYKKLVTTWIEADEWLENINLNVCNEMELYEQSINIMAQLTAIAVELFHKTGELLLIKEHRSTVDEADSLVQLTNTMTILISNAAKHITDKLNEKASQSTSKERINELITNVYFEATNSSSYVKNAFQLLIPVLQVGAV